MAEESIERLNRFTPETGRLDRDALLFAAGRRSARPDRKWIALASLLAGTQSLALLALFRPYPTHSPAHTPPVGESVIRVQPAHDSRVSEMRPELRSWTARARINESERIDDTRDALTLTESEPPLRAFPISAALRN